MSNEIQREHVELTSGGRTFRLDHVINPHINVQSLILAVREHSEWTTLLRREDPIREGDSEAAGIVGRGSVMTRFDLGVYVAPEHVEAVRALMLEKGDGCLLLDIERLIGARLDGPLTMPFVRTTAPYGTDIATVSLDDIDE